MKCPECGSPDSSVIDSRPYPEYVRRQRKCKACGERWTTWEVATDPKKTAKDLERTRKVEHLIPLAESVFDAVQKSVSEALRMSEPK